MSNKLGQIKDKNLRRSDVGNANQSSFKNIINNKFDDFYNDSSTNNKHLQFQKKMHQMITTEYSNFTPHVNGYYYVHPVHGTWVNHLQSLTLDNDDNVFDKDFKSLGDFSTFNKEHFDKISRDFGRLATDIDLPQINLEFESISGKTRNLNYVSKTNFNGDFSINFVEDVNNMVIRYHESWFKYINAYKKGYIKNNINKSNSNEFIDVAYFNAYWVVVFAPFSTNIRALIKIMGVAPINLPLKQILGDRSKSALTTLNQTYKSNDMIYKFYESEDDYNSPFFKEFLKDIDTIL